ncbi:MAG: hypothetical protein QOJ59_5197 [Thermomicrobiales bacterium]|jgi:hypothetical protein|nr:hypothetical protein [Thermomicrobiales bacterium]
MPNSPAGWLLTLLVAGLVLVILVDNIARRIARHGGEPRAAEQALNRRSQKDRLPARPPRPTRVRVTAVRPRLPDGATPAAPPPPGQFLTRRGISRTATVLVVVLMLGCAVLGFVADRSTSKDRRAAEKTGQAFIAALERGDAAAVLRLWFGGSMPLYDLTDCRDVDRRTVSTTPRRSLPIVLTRVDYEIACIIGPHQESHDRIYVEANLYWVYFLGHTRP